jgi:hypothetical protein
MLRFDPRCRLVPDRNKARVRVEDDAPLGLNNATPLALWAASERLQFPSHWWGEHPREPFLNQEIIKDAALQEPRPT